MSEDIATRTCSRCGQPVNRLTDSYKTIGGQTVHTSCSVRSAASASTPTSPELKAVPVLQTFIPSLQFIRVEDAARMLSVSTKTILRRIRTGELPAQRLRGAAEGGRQTILLNQADVLALLEPYVPSKGEEAGAETD